MQKCRKCNELLPLEKFGNNFYKVKSGERKLHKATTCMVCYRNSYLEREGKRDIHRKGSSNWYYNNPEKAKEQRLRKYKISLEEYNDRRKEQNYRCAICNKKEEDVAQGRAKTPATSLQVDHCHSTGKIRGLLCTNCNTMIGKADDDVSILLKAIEYINRHHSTVEEEEVVL